MEGNAAPIAKYEELKAWGEDNWESLEASWVNGDFKDPTAATARFWRNKNPHASSTAMVLKLETTFPNIEPEQVREMMSDIDTRMKWDKRIVEGKVVETCADGSKIIHHYTPKPPIPIIS